jgi:uncharacterized protein
MAASTDLLAPVSIRERISSVDTIRGVAVLGILLMNILMFGRPGPDDPSVMGETGVNYQTWYWVTLLFEGKMRAMFSMLFGAGLVIMTARAAARGREGGLADIYLRRNLWLLVFGVAHAFLLWDGDILYFYAACGLFLYAFRNVPPKWLIAGGIVVLLVTVPKSWLEGFDRECKRNAAQAAEAAKAKGAKLTPEQEATIGAWKEKMKEFKPDREELKKQIQAHQGSYLDRFIRRHGSVVFWQSNGFYLWGIWDVLGMMLIGMALMKLGVFPAEWPVRKLAILALATYAPGIALTWAMLRASIAANFEPVAQGYISMGYEPARALMGVGYASMLALVCRAGVLAGVRRGLAGVGQMALTNYLLASLVCTTLFYGYGFGLFGKLERHQLYFVVASVWVVQLALSPVWLRHFQYGPVEWAWRSLTYWKRHPLRIEREEEARPAAAAA